MSIYTMRTKLGQQIKWLLGLVALAVAIGAFFQFGGNPGGSAGVSSEAGEVIAVVNGLDVTRGEFENMWQPMQENYQQMGVRSPFMLANLRSSVFTQLVMAKVEASAAQTEKIKVGKREVKQEMDRMITDFLKADRERTLGTVSDEQSKTDPRKDKAYLSELAANQTSLGMRIDYARQMISEDQVREELSKKLLQEKIGSTLKPVTDQDVKDSYNEYSGLLILMPVGEGSPSDQVRNQAMKVRKEAADGADFKALANQYDKSGLEAGSPVTHSFDRPSLPPEIADAMKNLKPGQVSEVVESNFGYAIVKLVSVTPKQPEKMSKDATDERRDRIKQQRQETAWSEYMQKQIEAMKVEPKDPEFSAYWKLDEASKVFVSDKEQYKKFRAEAITLLKEALAKNERNTLAAARLAELYFQDAKYKEASLALTGLLSQYEYAEVRKMLGDAQVKLGEKDKALENYKIASEMSERNNPEVLRQLTMAYAELGREDLVKATQAKIAEYEKRKAQFETMDAENAPQQPAPAQEPKP